MNFRAVVLLLLIYPMWCGVMFAKQRTILFPAASDDRHPLAEKLPKGAQQIELPGSFGKVRAVFWSAQTSSGRGPSVLYLHGNYERIEDSFALVQPLVRAGVSVMQLEYPGFGGADGEPTFGEINEAADRAYDWLAQQPAVDAQRIVVMGYSIGGGIGADLVGRRHAAALILLSTFTSLEDMAHRYWLPGFLLRYQYDTLARVREFPGPLFVEHGRRDEVIPYERGLRLVAASPRADFVPLDCGHGDCEFDDSLFADRLPAWLAAKGLLDRSTSIREKSDASASQ